ncbi:MAG: porin family protein [Ekhidna sp.]|uniref:porin family protein n=1 Tax=Ekhidna sp. TaxID=2608089 RepID=UPI0032ED750A
MKNITIALLILLPILLFSQEERPQSIKLKVGANVTKGKAKDVDIDYSSAFGFSLGAVKDFKLGKAIYLESGIVAEKYTTEYSALIGSGIAGPIFLKTNDKFIYVSVPVIFQFHTGKVNFNTGPQVGYLLSAITQVKNSPNKEDVKDFTKNTMVNWGFGFEVNTPANFDIGARLLVGITDINNAKHILDSSYRLNTLQIYAAFPIDNF